MKVEFTPSEWANRSARLRRVRIRHECGDPKNCHVFICRDRAGHSCGRFCCQGVGGGEDNRCAKCWCAFERDAERQILLYLSERAWSCERALCRYFGCYDGFGVVEYALRRLKSVAFVYHWGGPSTPTRHVFITGDGREELARLNRARVA